MGHGLQLADWPPKGKNFLAERPLDEWPICRQAGLTMARDFREQMMAALGRADWSLAELQRRSGVTYDVLNKLKRRPGSSTSAENARAIRDALAQFWPGESPHLTVDLPAEVEDEARALIPVLDIQASAGPGLIPPDYEAVVYRLELPRDYLASLTSTPPEHLRVITVKGTSMLPTLKPGDLVMIDTAKTNLGYDGLFVLRMDDALHVKRVGRGSRRGQITIISDNREEQPPFERSVSDLDVLGKVVWRGVKE